MPRKTMRRDVLRRRIEGGMLVARCAHRYTDDYAGDAADKFGKTEWLPARIGERDGATGDAITIASHHFDETPAVLTVDDAGQIRFCPYRNLAFDLRPAPAAATA